jgi:hypothetical protein
MEVVNFSSISYTTDLGASGQSLALSLPIQLSSAIINSLIVRSIDYIARFCFPPTIYLSCHQLTLPALTLLFYVFLRFCFLYIVQRRLGGQLPHTEYYVLSDLSTP